VYIEYVFDRSRFVYGYVAHKWKSVPNVFIAFCLHGLGTFIDYFGLYVVINNVVTLTCTESCVCTRNQ
jgi:hypothetical protein